MIPVYKPYLPQKALKYAHEALESSWVSSHGIFLQKAQKHLENMLQVKHVLLVNNGTSATHLVSKALNFKCPNIRKLIVPNNVYVAAVNSFLFDRTLDLITVDADLETWNYDLNLLDKAIKTHWNADHGLAVLIVHNIGNIINVIELKRKYAGITFVEDNCEGFLGKYEDHHSGITSLASSISFFGNKNITSGEGGAVLTNDTSTHDYIKCVHGQGQSTTRFIHNEIGYNYRMTNVQAALLFGQLEVLPEILEKKQQLFSAYRDHVKGRDDVFSQKIEQHTNHANWMFGLRAVNSKGYQHAEDYFKDNSVEIRPMFYPLSIHTHLQREPKILFQKEDVAQKLNKECFILPSYPSLSNGEVKHILETLDNYLKEIKG